MSRYVVMAVHRDGNVWYFGRGKLYDEPYSATHHARLADAKAQAKRMHYWYPGCYADVIDLDNPERGGLA